MKFLNARSNELMALLGGTFDPIHFGHLRPVEQLAGEISLEKVILLPNNIPRHRPQPVASSAQRLKMLQLAVDGNPLFSIDDRELQRNAPSYTINTLKTLRKERGKRSVLMFIIGQDSLLTLDKWHRWTSLLDFCHLVVMARPGYDHQLYTADLQHWYDVHKTDDAKQLRQRPQGLIYQANTPLLDISATEIRQRCQQGLDCSDLLPYSVECYIASQGLYRT